MNWEHLLSASRQGQKTTLATVSSRSAFEQDFDRIIFSHPFRKLQDKTQVHPLPEHDFVHTRLTHSLEVSSVGRSLGRKVGDVIVQRHPELEKNFSLYDFGAITAAASLTHDLGNPPFGHAGEDALGDFFSETTYGRSFESQVTPGEWGDLTSFEGNAQGFRIINSNVYGLKLTLATLGAFTKYPCAIDINPRDKSRKSQKKYGFYQSEKKSFQQIAEALSLHKITTQAWCRHPLAFLVEAADDICYSIIDLEDGCRLGLITFNDTVDLLSHILKDDFKPEKLREMRGQNEKIGVLRALTINKLVDECTKVFLEHESKILAGSFDQALTDLCDSKDVLSQISKTSVELIYRARHVVEIEASGHEVLPGLLHEFIQAGELLIQTRNAVKQTVPRKYQNIALLFPIETRIAIEKAGATYEMLRLVLDFISGLTDKHALSLYRKIKGISL
ncbi:MAG TPA: dNTP triphosphohydrolase [Ohtaekwangia sp.]|nr:dNTP triphosphohydrolase [Ohtaekwangia sp.]